MAGPSMFKYDSSATPGLDEQKQLEKAVQSALQQFQATLTSASVNISRQIITAKEQPNSPSSENQTSQPVQLQAVPLTIPAVVSTLPKEQQAEFYQKAVQRVAEMNERFRGIRLNLDLSSGGYALSAQLAPAPAAPAQDSGAHLAPGQRVSLYVAVSSDGIVHSTFEEQARQLVPGQRDKFLAAASELLYEIAIGTRPADKDTIIVMPDGQFAPEPLREVAQQAARKDMAVSTQAAADRQAAIAPAPAPKKTKNALARARMRSPEEMEAAGAAQTVQTEGRAAPKTREARAREEITEESKAHKPEQQAQERQGEQAGFEQAKTELHNAVISAQEALNKESGTASASAILANFQTSLDKSSNYKELLDPTRSLYMGLLKTLPVVLSKDEVLTLSNLENAESNLRQDFASTLTTQDAVKVSQIQKLHDQFADRIGASVSIHRE